MLAVEGAEEETLPMSVVDMVVADTVDVVALIFSTTRFRLLL